MNESALPKYVPLTRALHWVVAVMVLATLPIGAIMLQEGLARPTQNLLFILHKNGGVILFLLVALRILWRLRVPAPPPPPHLALWQRRVAGAVHWALYALLLVMVISGYVLVRAGGFPVEMLDALGLPPLVPRSEDLAMLAKDIHANARFLLAGLIVLHLGAALQHALRRDGIFARIWPPVGK